VCVVYAVLTLHAIGARGGGHPTCGKVRCGTLAYKIHLEQAFLWEKILTRVHVQTSSRVKRCQPRSAQVLGAGTIDAYDRAQYAPMHGLPRGRGRGETIDRSR